ncbi:arginine-ornithine antiporter [Marinobacteraceae bacterium S3BR75-40.1]
MNTSSNVRLSVSALTAIVIGSMVGGGIFSLPQNTAASASAGAMLIGWLVTGVGMLALAFVFQSLAVRKPELDSGVYAYAKAGFGDYMGFSSAWGYWISAWIGNVSYFVLLFSSLGFFFPVFGEGNTLPAIIGASILLWLVHFLVLNGLREAAFINAITTVAKIVPLILFIILAAIGFKFDLFTADFWGASNADQGSVLDQVRNMMLVTVWVFIGIEGASVYSKRSGKRSDVGKATLFGFVSVLALLVLVNVLSYGIMAQAELAGLKNPSMAGVLEQVVGPWGATLINIGLIVSLCGALLSWTLLCAETLYIPAGDGTMPSFLAKENRKEVPASALWISNGLIQLFLLITLFQANTYLQLFYLATSMILVPYLWSALYALVLAVRGETYSATDPSRNKDLFIAAVAVIYAIWLLYAAGIQYLLLSAILYAPGAILFAMAKRERNQKVFQPYETAILVVVLIGAVIGVWGLYTGTLSL